MQKHKCNSGILRCKNQNIITLQTECSVHCLILELPVGHITNFNLQQ